MMAYVKIEDGIFRNPKVMQVGSSAKLLYVASICYAGSSLTNGFVPASAVKMLAAETDVVASSKVVRQLVDARLWDAVPGGYQVHDYLTYNESAEKVEAKRAAARARMSQRRSSEHGESGSRNVRAKIPRTSDEVREPTTEAETSIPSDEGTSPPQPPAGKGDAVASPTGGSALPHPEVPPVSTVLTNHQFALFERWYRAWPKKVGRAAAEKAWSQIRPVPDTALVDSMIATVDVWRESEQWRRNGGQYIPHPATWLKQGRWTDDPPPTVDPELVPNGRTTVAQRNAAAFDQVRSAIRSMRDAPEGDVIDVTAHTVPNGTHAGAPRAAERRAATPVGRVSAPGGAPGDDRCLPRGSPGGAAGARDRRDG